MSQRDESGLPIEGEYDAVVRMTELSGLEAGEKPFVNVGCEIEIDGAQLSIFGRIYVTEAAAGMARPSLRAIGWDPDKDLAPLHEDQMVLNGNKVRVKVVHYSNRNGEVKAKIDRFIPPRIKLEGAVRERVSAAAAAIKNAKG